MDKETNGKVRINTCIQLGVSLPKETLEGHTSKRETWLPAQAGRRLGTWGRGYEGQFQRVLFRTFSFSNQVQALAIQKQINLFIEK